MPRYKMVVAVAIREEDGRFIHTLKKPARHSDVLKKYFLANKRRLIGEQGFILSDGSFANRFRARKVAEKSGQLLDRAGDRPYLLSEDVW